MKYGFYRLTVSPGIPTILDTVRPQRVPLKIKLTQTVVAEALPSDSGKEVWIGDAEIPGFGLRVRPSGAKTYCIRYRTEGGRRSRTRRYTIGPVAKWKAEAARKKAKELLAEVVHGGDPADDRKKRRDGLAEEARVSRSNLGKHEKGVGSDPSLSTLEAYLTALECDLWDLARAIDEEAKREPRCVPREQVISKPSPELREFVDETVEAKLAEYNASLRKSLGLGDD